MFYFTIVNKTQRHHWLAGQYIYHYLTLCLLANFACFYSKSTFLKNSFRNTIRVPNSLDPDQTRHFGPDLGPNCSQMLSADNIRVKPLLA